MSLKVLGFDFCAVRTPQPVVENTPINTGAAINIEI